MKRELLVLILACYAFGSQGSRHFRLLSDRQLDQRIRYLQHVIETPLGDESAITQLSYSNGEWALFSYTFSALGLWQVAQVDTNRRQQALTLISTCIDRTLDPDIAEAFGVEPRLLDSSDWPELSVLYLGHLNLMLSCLHQLEDSTVHLDLHRRLSHHLAHEFRSKDELLWSYVGQIWIPDNITALASLSLSPDRKAYESVVTKTVSTLKSSFLDSTLGVLQSSFWSGAAQRPEEPRGSMLGWSIMMLWHVDPSFAREQWLIYRKKFSHTLILLRPFRERHGVRKTSGRDVDSGPIIRGHSVPANAFALPSALRAGHVSTARKIHRMVKWFTGASRENDAYRYKIPLIPFRVTPMAEAFMLFALTSRTF